MKNILFLLLMSTITTLTFGQGAIDGYMKGKGNLDIAISASYEGHSQYFYNKEKAPLSNGWQAYGFFAAYGISDKFDVIASLPYVRSDKENSNFQDGSLFFKYRLASIDKKEVGRIDVMAAIGATTPVSRYQADSVNAIGQQVTSIEPRVVVQINSKFNYFVMFKGGFSFKIDAPNVIPVVAKIGFTGKKYYADFWVEGQKALSGNNLEFGATENPNFRTVGVSSLRIGGTYYYTVKPKFGVFINAARVLTGRNVGLSTRIGVGFVVKI